MSSSFQIDNATLVCHLPSAFPLEHGGELTSAQLAYEVHGASDAPLVLAQGGITAGRHAKSSERNKHPGWWEALVGRGKAIDTNRFRVLSFDYIGGQGATTGPSNSIGRFPAISSFDQARALAHLLDQLQVQCVHSFVGASYGGMVGLAFAATFPERLASLIAISAAHESDSMATAWRTIQRRIVRLGQQSGRLEDALALARSLAMTGYRSRQEFSDRFAPNPDWREGRACFAVEDYLLARGRAFANSFDAEAFLTLSQAIDLHRVEPEDVQTPTLLIGIDSDQLVPIAQLRLLATALPHANLHEISSRFGHDAFLKEVDKLAPLLRAQLSGEAAA